MFAGGQIIFDNSLHRLRFLEYHTGSPSYSPSLDPIQPTLTPTDSSSRFLSVLQLVVGKIACNLLSFSDSQHKAVEAGAVEVLKCMCTLGDPTMEELSTDAFFLISAGENYRKYVLRSDIIPTLVLLSRSSNRYQFHLSS